MTAPLGSFVWYEFMASDAKAAADFYTAVVGWSAKDAGMAGFPYTLLSVGPNMVAGLMTLPEEARAMGARPGWLGYLAVPDVDAYATKIVAAGGAIYRPAADIPGVGRFAVAGDPHGAGVCRLQGRAGRGPAPAARALHARQDRLARVARRRTRKRFRLLFPTVRLEEEPRRWIWARWEPIRCSRSRADRAAA